MMSLQDVIWFGSGDFNHYKLQQLYKLESIQVFKSRGAPQSLVTLTTLLWQEVSHFGGEFSRGVCRRHQQAKEDLDKFYCVFISLTKKPSHTLNINLQIQFGPDLQSSTGNKFICKVLHYLSCLSHTFYELMQIYVDNQYSNFWGPTKVGPQYKIADYATAPNIQPPNDIRIRCALSFFVYFPWGFF